MGASQQRWVWRDFQFELPGDWELLQYSKEWPQGRCAFADRRQFRFELNWSETPKALDMVRLLSDYRSKLVKDKKAEDCSPARIAGWHGLTGRQHERPMSRFGNYFEGASCLVELVFLWPEERDAALENAVLRSFSWRVPDTGGLRLWRAFGMELLVPEVMQMSACRVQPAMASLAFEEARKRPNSMRFERFGMVACWLDSSLEDWVRTRLPVSCVFETKVREWTDGGVRFVGVEGEYRPHGLIHRNGHYTAVCWIDGLDGRLYFAERIARRERMRGEVLRDCLKAAPSEQEVF